jgi:hypothetical protein
MGYFQSVFEGFSGDLGRKSVKIQGLKSFLIAKWIRVYDRRVL